MTSAVRVVKVVSVLALVTLIASVIVERRQTPAGFHQVNVGLEGGVPATLYFQDPDANPELRPGVDRPAYGSNAPPGIVLAHGYGFDRRTMQSLAESLTRSGYTVVSIDESGHGMNRNPYRVNSGRADHLATDIRAGVEFLRGTLGLPPSQIAVVGHSMGARAALAYGSHETAVAGLVMISGSTDFLGPRRLPNALFLYAQQEFPGIERSISIVAADLAQVAKPEPGRTYGDFAAGTAVRMVRIPGTGHGTIPNSPAAFREIVAWLDGATGRPRRSEPATFAARPLGPPLQWLSFLLVLPGLGALLARFAPVPAESASGARLTDPGLLATALLLPLLFVANGRAGLLMGLSDADTNVTHLAYGGIILALSLIALGRLRRVPDRVPGSLAVAMIGWLAVTAMLGPVSAHFHGVGLTPEKAGLWLWAAVCLLPFAFAFQLLLRRERWWKAALLRLLGRVIVLIAVATGNALGVFGFPGTIAVVVLLAALVIVEPILAGFYAGSKNLLTAAGLDAIVTGWLFALLLPANF